MDRRTDATLHHTGKAGPTTALTVAGCMCSERGAEATVAEEEEEGKRGGGWRGHGEATPVAGTEEEGGDDHAAKKSKT